MSEDNSKTSRRSFFGKLALVGAGAAAGAAVVYTGSKYEKSKDPKGKVQLLTADNKLVEVDASAIEPVKLTESEGLQSRGREGLKGRKWVMVVDLSKCRNARKCVASCQNAHDLKPGQYHMNVLQMQDSPETAPYNMPKPCQHCDNPPCVSVCPVDATFKRQDGIVLIDNERCIGCRFCMAACPYSARIFHWQEPKVSEEHKNKVYDIELNVPQKKGTISKCLFSADRLRDGKLPYCTEACPNGVYWFGDENEDAVTNGTTKETRKFSELLKENGGYNLMPDLGTKPRVYYLPAKNRLFPFEKTDDPIEKELS
jgi:Fe-S-cluster-containing dehydrogenase component